VNLKMYPGRSEEQKQEAARRIIAAVREVCNVAEGADFPVVIEEVTPEEWDGAVGPEVRKAARVYP